MNRTVDQQANQLAMLRAVQESMVSNDAYVTFDYTDDNGKTLSYQIPSYDSVVRRLQAVEQSLNALSVGKGTVSLEDGSRRTVHLSTIPHTPDRITGLVDPSTFTVDSNWFFEELMFPGARVSIDLTGQIEDTADRVQVTRIILSAENNDARTLWESDLSQNNYDYVTLKNVLSQNGVPYYEDEETVNMPLVSNQLSGDFQVVRDPEIRNGKVWYYLDNITYSTISSDGLNQGQNNLLSIGDTVSYQESIFEIQEIDQTNKCVRMRRTSGVQSPGQYSMLSLYQDPFRDKSIKVRFGAHEYNIIYFKGISENYNLLGNTWSTPVKFSSDELILEGTSGLQETPFANYYAQYIMDWGQLMIAEYRERKIPAWFGHTPNAPTLAGADFRVVQINTQINAAIDTTQVKNTAAEIQSVKSQISSLEQTIAAQKSEAQGISEQYKYNALQQQIETNINDLNNLQTTYSTLVSSFQSIVRENSAVIADPKYHIRGFFDIPEFQYTDETQSQTEEIIGFDIAYRYIKEDDTATQLNTFTYTSTDGTEHTGTFTDWVVEQGPMKTKVLDPVSGQFVWKAENIADGTETNINQIDIAINKGEKVEIKVRSISEAGYPSNPLRSDWSESVIMEFPSTLATGNQIADLIEEVNSDALVLTVQNKLDALGVTTHLDDTVANKNSVTGLYFKHLSENIAYEQETTDSSGNVTVQSISVQKKLDDLALLLNALNTQTKNIQQTTDDTVALVNQKTTLYDEEIYDLSTSLSRIGNNISDLSAGLNSALSVNRDDQGTYHPKLQAERYTFMDSTAQAKSALALPTDSTNDIALFAGTGDAVALSNVWVNDVLLRPKTTDEARSLKDSLNNHDNDISTHNARMNNMQTDINSRALQTSLDATNQQLQTTTAMTTDTKSKMDTIYNESTNQLKADGFIVLNGSNTAGIMGGGANGIEFQAAGGSGYVNITADDVFVPVMTGGNSQPVSMKTMNSQLEDVRTEHNELREDFDSLKTTFDRVVNIDNEQGRNVYADNVITSQATVDDTLVVGTLQIKGTEFQPEDSDGNRVPIRVQNVYINNTDVQNEILNLKAWRTQTEAQLTGPEGIGVGSKIRYDNDGLIIEAQSVTANTFNGKQYYMLDDESNIKGYIAQAGADSDFEFRKSSETGTAPMAAIKCASVGLNLAGSTVWIDAQTYDTKSYVQVQDLAVGDKLVTKDVSIDGAVNIKGNVNITDGDLTIQTGNLMLFDPYSGAVRNILDIIEDLIRQETADASTSGDVGVNVNL